MSGRGGDGPPTRAFGSIDETEIELRPERRQPQPDSTWVVLATMVLAMPLAVALVVLASRSWQPVLDLAMTEIRVRDVGTRRTPLIGLPGRIGEFPDQGSHPGPLSFYLWAGPYRVFGSSAWALQVASAVVNLVAVLFAVAIGARRGGRVGVAVVAGVVALMVRGFGVELFLQPWNPYAPLLWWLVAMLAAWSVLLGDHRMLVALVLAVAYCSQTHVSYVLLGGSMVLLAAAAMAVNLRRVGAVARGPLIASVWTAVVVGVLLWVPALVDQIRRRPGNLRQLFDHFGAPGEPAIGLWAGFQHTLRHLDPGDGLIAMITDPAALLTAGFDPERRVWLGAVVLLVWLAAVGVAVRLGHRTLVSLHAVVALALAVGVVNMSRIFGKLWYYLTLWAWVTSAVLAVAVVWTLAVALRRVVPDGLARRIVSGVAEAVAVIVVVAAAVASTVSASDARPPEAHLSDTLGGLLPATLRALDEERIDRDGPVTGEGASYVVTWSDAYFFGSQGYGLVNELERRGYEVGVLEPWRVPMTPYRVVDPAEVDTGIHLATGVFVEEWRGRDEAIEIAFVEPRTAAERAEYAELRREVLTELRARGLTELVSLVDTNLFGVSNDPRVGPEAARAMARMLVLGQETAVFLVPPGAAP